MHFCNNPHLDLFKLTSSLSWTYTYLLHKHIHIYKGGGPLGSMQPQADLRAERAGTNAGSSAAIRPGRKMDKKIHLVRRTLFDLWNQEYQGLQLSRNFWMWFDFQLQSFLLYVMSLQLVTVMVLSYWERPE
jgi:hypothetical protein